MPPARRKPRKSAANTASKAASRTTSETPTIEPGAELIVIAEPGAALRIGADGIASAAGADVSELREVSSRSGITITPLFGAESRIRARTDELRDHTDAPVPELDVYYHVDAPPSRLAELAEELLASEAVSAAYVKPAGEPPVMHDEDLTPAPGDAPPTTPDFSASQGYLDPAPGGIDARYAWTFPGGGGASVSVIDCEWGWRFDHEDLMGNQGGVVVGTGGTDTHHGTAVIGEISGDRNTIGITGIAPDAFIRAAAFSLPTAQVIRQAADRLAAGDLILLEIHRAGPRNNFAARQDQNGYIAIEWWPDDFDAIRYAIARGIIVVEAAGNGRQDLDDPLYSTRPAGFPVSWTNPFNRSNRDSGAIIVGAGAPPSGNHGADRSRLDFSNFGACVDAQGWGREVVTTGYGDLQGGDPTVQYTRSFSGTSSASPIVTGALACLQGALRARGKPVMTPVDARAWLRETGSPQQDGPNGPATQRIGNRPDLKALFAGHVKDIAEKLTIKEVKFEKLEIKDAKREGKESKFEKLETKERKAEKPEIKEVGEGKRVKTEIKEVRDKNVVEDKSTRIEKQLVREKPIDVGGGFGRFGGGPDAPGAEDRLADLEQAVLALAHFIGADLRPDLTGGALTHEDDVTGRAAAAKDSKDAKDKEHLAEW